jgi:type I restriction enzyme S subunit
VSFNQDIKAITPKTGSLLPAFLFWMLKGQEAQILRIGVKKGATVHSLANGFLEALRFPLPPLDEQRRIVGLLDRAAEIRRRADAARAKARTIIPALFLDTFGDPATNPKGWPTAAIGDVVKLTGGGTPSKANPEFWSGTIPWVSPKDMKPQTIFDSEDKITAAAMAASPVKLIPAGNVLIVVRGMILAHTVPIRMNAVDVTLNQDMKALVPNKQILPTFLRWALGSLHGYFLSKVREAAHGTKKLETDVLTSYPIVLPPMELQEAFAEQAHRLEALAHHLDAAAAKAEAMAAGLSAEVFGAPATKGRRESMATSEAPMAADAD